MKSTEFTIDNWGFASHALSASQRSEVEDIARWLTDDEDGASRLNDVERILVTGFSSGTDNLGSARPSG
jgi:hypothetical protein